MDNIAKKMYKPGDFTSREAHFIGVSQIRLGEDVYYDLYEQEHHPWFVLVLRNESNEGE